MAYSHKSTTNNVAEYWGLIHGLRGAQAHDFTPLTIIGDSNMIIRQNKRHLPPKNARLRDLYYKARRIADCIGVTTWSHHYREYNKMADRAANQAMDSQRSQQALASASRDFTKEIAQLLPNDFQHWISVTPHHTTLNTQLRALGLNAAPTIGAYLLSVTPAAPLAQ